jgi:NitT/TauT family transport system substrate-binding protein
MKLRNAFIVMLALLAVGATNPLRAQELTKVRVSLGDVSLNKLIFAVAEDAGIFKKNGLDVEMYISPDAAARSARAGVFIPKERQGRPSGKVDFNIGGGSPMIVGRATDATAGDRIILASTDHVVRWHIVAQKEITKPEQLKGKRLGFSGVGAMSHFEALAFCQLMKWDPNQDIALMENALALDTFEDRTVDAMVADELVYTMGMSKGYRPLVDLGQYNIPIPGSGVTASRKWVNANKDTVRKFLKATLEAIALLKNNKTVVFGTINKWYAISNREQQEMLFQDMTKLPRKPYPHVPGIKKVMELYNTAGMRMFKPEDFYDDSFIKEFDQSGFIDSLYK